jgi:hypothetical protein
MVEVEWMAVRMAMLSKQDFDHYWLEWLIIKLISTLI